MVCFLEGVQWRECGSILPINKTIQPLQILPEFSQSLHDPADVSLHSLGRFCNLSGGNHCLTKIIKWCTFKRRKTQYALSITWTFLTTCYSNYRDTNRATVQATERCSNDRAKGQFLCCTTAWLAGDIWTLQQDMHNWVRGESLQMEI